jgi:gliding motility-associated-like protein
MKKIFILLFAILAFGTSKAQTQVAIGNQSSTFSSMVRGYHFVSPVNFTLCGLYVPTDASSANQSVAVVRFTAGAPPAFPGTTNAFTLLFQQQNYAVNAMIPCNIPIAAGDVIGVYGSRGGTCINSYDGVNYATTIMGMPTNLLRSGMQQCLQTVSMANIWSEVNFSVGRIFMYYNCCTTPTVTAVASPTSVCQGMNVALLGGGANTYTWSPGNIVGAAINVTPTANTTYTVSGTSTAGCTATKTVAVTVNPNPTVTAAAAPSTVCAGQSANLTGAGATTYTWQPGNMVGAAISVTPAATTIYTVTGSNAFGCTNTRTVQVTVNPLPVVTPGSNSPVCLGGNINLTVNAFTTYTWTGPNAFNNNTQNPTLTNATAAMGGVYTVSVTNAQGCKNSNTVNVVINPLPVITPTNNGPYCVGQTINLNTAAAASYTWSGPNAYSSNAQSPTIANAQTNHSGTYSVSVTSAGGCISSGTTVVTVNPLPVPAANNTGPYCPGNTIQLSTGAFTSYTWTGPASYNSNIQNATLANAQPTNSGVYTVVVTDANGCTNTANTTVVVNPSPVPNAGSNSPVCLNFPLNLTSNAGGGTYSWTGPGGFSSNVQNPTIAAATLANAGVYTLTVTTLGCSSVGNVTVSVITPTVNASNAGPFCAGTTMTLNSTAASSFTWSGPGGFTSSSQNPTQANSTVGMTGTYTLLVSIGTCTASSTTNVVVNALPTPTVGSNSPLCVGQTINLTGAGGTTYTWSGPGSYASNASNPSITNANTTNSGNYVLTVTNNNGCTNTANVNVVVNPLPVIAVSNPTNCVNTTINLTSNGGVTYTWSGPNTFSSNAQNPSITSAQLNMSGVYVVTVTDANNCVNSASANVSVLPLPIPNIVANSPICAGGTLNLQGSGGANYAWNGPGYTGLAQNPTINNITSAAGGVYTLLVSSGTCTASTTFTVVVNPLPVFNFTSNNVLCNGQSNGTSTVNVTVGTSPFNFQWSNGQNTQTATGLNAGTYSCIVTDANNCSSLATTQITQPTTFNVAINTITTSACANSPINVSANGNGGTTPYTYTWVAGPTASLYSINEAASGNYIYTVNATDANGCVSSNNVSLTFFPQPTVTATSATLCAGQSTNLTASGAYTYTWQPGNVTGSSYQFSGNTSVNVTVIGSMNGCSNSANASIVVNPNPNASISTTANKSCAPSCVTFTANGSSSVVSYGWLVNGLGITGGQNANYCFPESGTYTLGLNVVDNNGCSANAAPVNIEVYPNPIADFNYSPLKPIINIDQEVTFTDASHNANIASWNWYFMNTAQYTSVLQNPSFIYTEPGTYAVALVVKSDQGCMDTLVRELIVGEDFGIYVPNAFTPNGDGLNDVFQPKGFGITKYELNIYDRWGALLFHTDKFEEGWNGAKEKNMDVSYPLIIEEGTYSWIITCTSVYGKSHELTGHVVLIK